MEYVPKQEIKKRIDNFQSHLKEQGFTCAFIFQNVDIFYFTGTIQKSVLFIPVEGDPVLMVQKSLTRAQQESPLEQIIPLKNLYHVPQSLHDLGIDPSGTAGLELDVLPAYIYLWFQDTFRQCHTEDVSPSIRKLRMIKSAYEIEQIKRASIILHTGLTEIAGILKEGMTELEIDGYMGYIARREGHMGIMRMRGWNQEMTYVHVLSGKSGSVPSFLNSPQGGEGTTPAMAQGAGFKKIAKNEPIEIDYGAAVNGYISDQSRTYTIGQLPKRMEKAHECSKRILMFMEKEARPGTVCSDLYHMAVEEAELNGFKDVFMGYGDSQAKFVGHGVGLEIDDLPLLSHNFNNRLQEGMVMAIEPKFVFPELGVVGLEDVYEVTSSGLNRLTLTDQEIIHIKPA